MPKSHRNSKNKLKARKRFSERKKEQALQKYAKKVEAKIKEDYEFLANPLNILILLTLYLNNEVKDKRLVTFIETMLEETKLDITQINFSKNDIRIIWLWQMEHDQLYCDICGKHISNKNQITLDHRYPKSHGGKIDQFNSKPAHRDCNRVKDNIVPDDWKKIGLTILKENNIDVDLEKCGYSYYLGLIRKEHQR